MINLGRENGSSRPMGPVKMSIQNSSRTQAATVLAIRIVSTIIITVSMIWFYLLYRIVNDFGGLEQSSDVARPPVFNPHDVSRLEWLLKLLLETPAPLLDVSRMDSPVFMITCERAEYLDRALWKVYEYHPAHQMQTSGNLRRESENSMGRVMGSPVIISQDGDNSDVRAVVDTYRNLFERKLGVPLYHIHHHPSEVTVDTWEDWKIPYKRLSIHYGWALEKVFSGSAYNSKQKHTRSIPKPPLPKRAVILEEDIEVSRDFFSLMNATADILDRDDTLLAVSAYNDNGNENQVFDHKRLVRSDFFPGLGWMINRQTWEGRTTHSDAGLKGKWPDGFWDDWIRESNIRRGRQVLRPEVSRTFHFGNVKGASPSDTAMKLSKIRLDEINVNWEEQDLSYLDAVAFAEKYWERVSRAELVPTDVDAKKLVAHKDVRILYSDWKQFKSLASSLGIMQDEKAGVPRTAYEGIVEIRYGAGNYFIYLTPPVIETSRPADFGMKAWADFTKEALLQRLGITDKTDEWNFI